MPLPTLNVPQFPNVPNYPGVPPVLRDTATQAVADLNGAINRLFSDNPLVETVPQDAVWGIFDTDYVPICDWDNIIAIDFLKEAKVCTYPLQGGAFEAYNKVQSPFDVRVTLSKGVDAGFDTGGRTAFMQTLQAATSALTRYQVITPEITYENLTVQHVDYRRESRSGVSLITADVWLTEIRETVTTKFTQTKQPAGAATVNNGTVAAQTPTTAQAGAIG